MLRNIKSMCPELVPIFYSAYGKPTTLRSTTTDGKNQIVGSSETGARQGDPLSMLFFAIAIHPTMERIDAIVKEEIKLAEEAGDIQVVSLFTESLGEAGSAGATYLDMVRTNAELIAEGLSN